MCPTQMETAASCTAHLLQVAAHDHKAADGAHQLSTAAPHRHQQPVVALDLTTAAAAAAASQPAHEL